MKTPVRFRPGPVKGILFLVFDDGSEQGYQVKSDANGYKYIVLKDGVRMWLEVFAPLGLPLPAWKDGDLCYNSNFKQEYYVAGPVLIDGGKRVTFNGCLLLNCRTTLPPVACNTVHAPDAVEPPSNPKEEAYQMLRLQDADWLKQRAMTDFKLTAAKAGPV